MPRQLKKIDTILQYLVDHEVTVDITPPMPNGDRPHYDPYVNISMFVRKMGRPGDDRQYKAVDQVKGNTLEEALQKAYKSAVKFFETHTWETSLIDEIIDEPEDPADTIIEDHGPKEGVYHDYQTILEALKATEAPTYDKKTETERILLIGMAADEAFREAKKLEDTRDVPKLICDITSKYPSWIKPSEVYERFHQKEIEEAQYQELLRSVLPEALTLVAEVPESHLRYRLTKLAYDRGVDVFDLIEAISYEEKEVN